MSQLIRMKLLTAGLGGDIEPNSDVSRGSVSYQGRGVIRVDGPKSERST
jgi:hypothetical protein